MAFRDIMMGVAMFALASIAIVLMGTLITVIKAISEKSIDDEANLLDRLGEMILLWLKFMTGVIVPLGFVYGCTYIVNMIGGAS